MNDLPMDKITELLNSPDLMKNVQSVLGQLGSAPNESKSDLPVATDAIQALSNAEMSGLLSSVTEFLSKNKTERVALLTALKPFLSAEKQNLLDSILQILKVANIFLSTNLLKQGG